MNRILEFSPSQEEAVVARILVLVHQAVDTHFPAAAQATRQFTKTVFSGEGESTASVRAAPDGEGEVKSAFGNDESTSPDGHPAIAEKPTPYIPPPPPGRPAGSFAAPPNADGQPERSPFASNTSPTALVKSVDLSVSKSTRLDATIDEMRAQVGLDWTMRLTLAALIAGLILSAYFFWKFISLG